MEFIELQMIQSGPVSKVRGEGGLGLEASVHLECYTVTTQTDIPRTPE